LAELLDAARKQPSKLNYASGSAGYQLMTESLAEATGVKFFNVPYRGASEAVTAVAGGNANLAVVDITAGGQLARSGTVKALAVAGDRRSSVIPDVPTVKEAGVPNYTAYVWVAAMVSAKTPPPAIDKLVELFTRASAKPETKEYFASQGSELMAPGPEALRKFQREEIDRWKSIAVAAKVEPQ
jgi:tripartite-type tricarboxylate transporter receptor subunit TctC